MNEKHHNAKKNSLCSFCVWLLALSPMLDSYVFVALPTIPIQFIIYIAIFLILAFNLKNKKLHFNAPQKNPAILALMLITISTISILSFGIGVNFVANFGKLIIWGISLYLFSGFIDKEHLSQTVIRVAVFNASVAIIQALFYYILNIRLPNVFDLGIITHRVNDMSQFINAYRPAALFSEPASFSVYALVALVISLSPNRQKSSRKKSFANATLIIGLILSASTTGLAILVAVLLYGLLTNYREKPLKTIALAILLIFASAFCALKIDYIVENTGAFGRVISKSIYKVNNTDSNARIGGSLDKIDLSDKNILLGYGIGNEYYILDNKPAYMNSFARSILQYGIVGTSLILAFLASDFFEAKSLRGKALAIMMITLIFTGNILFTTTNFLALLLIYLLDIKDAKIAKHNNYLLSRESTFTNRKDRRK